MRPFSAKLAAMKDMRGQFEGLYLRVEKHHQDPSQIVDDNDYFCHKLLTNEEVCDMDEFHFQSSLHPL